MFSHSGWHRYNDKQDKFGRTAWHYAAIGGNATIKDLLKKKKKTDDTVQDKFQMTAEEYTSVRERCDTFFLRMTQTSSFTAGNFRTITQYVQKYCFAEEIRKTEIRKIICDLRGHDATSYVQSIRRGCRFDYTGNLCRKPVSYKQCIDNFIHCKQTIEDNANQAKLNNN